MYRHLLLYTLGVTLLLGCSGGMTRERLASLDASIDKYVAALRWSRMNEARGYHRYRDGSQPEIDLTAVEAIRVTGYDISRKTVNEDLNQASVTAVLEYYNSQYGTVKETTLEQDWWYDPQAGRWYLASDFPIFD